MMMNNDSNNNNNGSETSSNASAAAASGSEGGIISGGFKGGKRTRRPSSFSVRPSFSLGALPERKLKPMTAVTTDLTTGTTSYTVQPQQPPIVSVPRPSSALPPCPARNDCIDRDRSQSSAAAAAASSAAAGSAWHHHSATPSSTSVKSHSATNVAPNVYLGGQADATNATLLRKLRIRRILNVAGEIMPTTPLSNTMTVSPKGGCPPLMELGIKRVSSYGTDSACSSDSEQDGCCKDVMEHIQTLHIQLRDHSDEDIASHFEQALKFIRDGVVNGEAVLVHCRFGVSRSATIVLAYLMVYGCKPASTMTSSSSCSISSAIEAIASADSMSYERAFDHVKSRRAQVSPNLGFVLALHDLEARVTAAVAAKKSCEEQNEEGEVEEKSVPFGLSFTPLSCQQQQHQFCSPFPVTSSSTAGFTAVQCN